MSTRVSKLKRIADAIEQSSIIRLARVFEIVAILAALVAFFLELQNRSADRAIRVATLFSQIAMTLEVEGGPRAVRASVAALAEEKVDMFGIYLSGADLRTLDLADARLHSADLTGATLISTDLHRAIGSSANLNGANLYRANLSNSVFYGANFSDARLVSADLSNARLYESNFRRADLTSANLSGAIMVRTNLQDAILNGANLTAADFQNADFRGIDLTGACFIDTAPKLPQGYTVPEC